jgi:hypothetical protein
MQIGASYPALRALRDPLADKDKRDPINYSDKRLRYNIADDKTYR